MNRAVQILEVTAQQVWHAPWTATEHLRVSRGMMMAHVDPEKMVAAREAGASSWELHERAVAGEFAPEKPYDPGKNF
jgi:catechol 2,3-dioxygenase